jgi:shikimate dehydrogenase
MKIKRLGLIGYPLGHSFSAGYFAEKFKKEAIKGFRYDNFPIESIGKFPELIENNPDLIGLNVTIPYKEQVIPFLDELTPEAQSIGAVNTIKILRKDGEKPYLIGHNTDCFGFQESLKPLLRGYHHKALILGTGGAAKAVEYVLKNIGLEVRYVSRNPDSEGIYKYEELEGEVFNIFKVIVNSTPLGMHPNVDNCPPIPYELLNSENLLYDLVYNPAETLFLKKGKVKGALIQNGLPMLQLQAEGAWKFWNS